MTELEELASAIHDALPHWGYLFDKKKEIQRIYLRAAQAALDIIDGYEHRNPVIQAGETEGK